MNRNNINYQDFRRDLDFWKPDRYDQKMLQISSSRILQISVLVKYLEKNFFLFFKTEHRRRSVFLFRLCFCVR